MNYLLLITLNGVGLLACQSSKSSSAGGSSLTEHRWVLTELQGQPVAKTSGRNAASLQFSAAEQRVSGAGGCNRLFGTYERSEPNGLKFKGIASTRMACFGPDTETPFLAALNQVDRFTVANGVLSLQQGQTVLARLRAAPLEK